MKYILAMAVMGVLATSASAAIPVRGDEVLTISKKTSAPVVLAANRDKKGPNPKARP